MSRWFWSAALLAIALGTASSSVGLAKPPDLPADNEIRCPETPAGDGTGVNPELSASAQKARALFEAAGRCLRAGDINGARACLRKAHMANPTSHYGQRAIQRLLEMEAYDPSEESEPPAPSPGLLKSILRRIIDALPLSPLSEEAQSDEDEPSEAEQTFRRVRESTQPLGMSRGQTF
jgi:hypothetical protein